MGQGDAAGLEVGEHRLDVADEAAAGGRVAGVADGAVAGQALDEVGAGEGVADVAHVAFGVEPLAVERGDAAGLLAAMLQGVQAERDDGAGLVGVIDAEDAAFETRPVVVRVAEHRRRKRVARGGGGDHRRDFSTISSIAFRDLSS